MVRERKLFFSLNVKKVSILGIFFAFCTYFVVFSCAISLFLSVIIIDKQEKICYNSGALKLLGVHNGSSSKEG